MERVQYIVGESLKDKRKEFYDYIISNYGLEVIYHSKEHMINSKFPFVVDFRKKQFWVCESVACCSVAQQYNLIITIDEFKKLN